MHHTYNSSALQTVTQILVAHRLPLLTLHCVVSVPISPYLGSFARPTQSCNAAYTHAAYSPCSFNEPSIAIIFIHSLDHPPPSLHFDSPKPFRYSCFPTPVASVSHAPTARTFKKRRVTATRLQALHLSWSHRTFNNTNGTKAHQLGTEGSNARRWSSLPALTIRIHIATKRKHHIGSPKRFHMQCMSPVLIFLVACRALWLILSLSLYPIPPSGGLERE